MSSEDAPGLLRALQPTLTDAITGEQAGSTVPSHVVDIRRRGTVTVVRLGGELDVVGSAALRDQLSAVPRRARYVVDLAELDFIDCSCLRILATFRQNAQSHGRRVSFVGARGKVRRILILCDLESWLEPLDAVDHSRILHQPSRPGWHRRVLRRT